MAGIREVCEALHGALSAVVPVALADSTFRGPRPDENTGMEPAAWIESPLRELREFQIIPSPGVRNDGCLLVARVTIRIAYPLAIPGVQIAAASDSGLIARAIASSPSAWGPADSLAAVPVERALILTDDRLPAVLVFSYPFDVLYREAP